MAHADDESLAALALGEPVGDEVRDHVAACATCRRQREELADLVDLARSARHDGLVAPPPAVWLGVAAQLDGGADAPLRALPDETPVRRRRRSTVLVAAAVAGAVLLGGVGGWALAQRRDGAPSEVVASTGLTSLEGGEGRGTARVLSTPGHTTLQVDATSLASDPGDLHEVWLINADGRRMVAIGLLPSADAGSFAVLPRLLEEGYRTVDISVEPDDGDPAHSGRSVARGTLVDG